MHTKKIYLLLLFFICLTFNLYSQVDREFWFAIPKETGGHGCIGTDESPHDPDNSVPNSCIFNNVNFVITAMNLDATVTISMPADGTFTPITFTVPAGRTHIETMATSWSEFEQIYNNYTAYNAAPLTQITNRGFLITSTTDITAYYDYDNFYNRDLFSLKGKNALGTEFFTPFQNIWYNDSVYDPDPYSTIEIVATENGTDVTITPQPGQSFEGRPDDSPWTVTLDRGEAYSIRAKYMSASGHNPGVKITSTKKIAVTTNDDSTRQLGPSCRDINGDQLVPTDIIGSEYVVMTGNLSNDYGSPLLPPYKYTDGVGEQIFVTATVPGTVITFKGMDGTILYQTPVLAAGKSDYMSVDITNSNMSSIYVSATDLTKKFYTYHITGIGCELGGAILPPITNCTGSNEVSFYRSNTVGKITVNLMIPYNKLIGFNDPAQSHNNFYLITYQGATPDTFHIPNTWFEANANAGWAVLKMAYRDFGAETTSGEAHKIINNKDFFHLGMTNGTSGQTNKYGYFSSFNATVAEVYIPQNQEDNIIRCYGSPVTIVAKGGLEYTWHYGSASGAPLYLSDAKSANPDVIGAPVGSHNFYVEVQHAQCFPTDTLKVNVVILPVVTADFDVSDYSVCSPDTITFINKSEQADLYYWRKQVDSNPEFDMSFTLPNTPTLFRERMDNLSPTTLQTIKYTLRAESLDGCSDTTSKTIQVFPRIAADFTQNDTLGCHPLPVQFTNSSGGNTDLYLWNFGDQGSSNDTHPSHIFENFGPADTTYIVQLIAKSPSPFFCTDTAWRDITVHPYIFAHYATDTTKACSPIDLRIQNGSHGAIDSMSWDYDDGNFSNRTDSAYFYHYTNISNANIIRRLKLSVFNTAKCIDSIYRDITIYPEIQTQFSPSVDTGCNPLPVMFTNLSNAAADSFYWDFGDGTSSYLKSPAVHEYQNLSLNDTLYKVKLRATTSELCPGYDSTLILVRGFIDARFSNDTSASCAPFDLTVKNESVGGPLTTYTWNFGDSSADSITSAPQITHTYRDTTTSLIIDTISLTLTGTGGCRKTIVKPIRVFPEIHAGFDRNSAGCNALTDTFINLSTPVVASKFLWSFGDGSSSTEQNPIHTFSHLKPSDQVYPVKLISTSIYNCKDSITRNTTVYSFINANFTIDKGQDCSPFTVNITDSSSGGITSRLWNTGVMPMPGNLANYTYINKTDALITRNLQLIIRNSRGCIDTLTRPVTIFPEVSAFFIPSDTLICDSANIDFHNDWTYNYIIDKFRWEFGDNASSSTNYTGHRFRNVASDAIATYTTQLYINSIHNCADSFQRTIYVYPYIKANFSVENARGCSPLTVKFTRNCSLGAKEFEWFYDDGTPGDPNNSSVISYQYRNPDPYIRTYKPRLKASFYNDKCADYTSRSIDVYPEVTAAFNEDTLQGCHPLDISFTNTSINANTYTWFFGDNGSISDMHAPHRYANFSLADVNYTARLVATSSDYNCSDDTFKTVTVYPQPKADFKLLGNKFISCPPFNVQILNQSLIGDTFLWTYGDTSASFKTNSLGLLSHTYDNATNDIWPYTLDLLVTTRHNCQASNQQTINVFPRVRADIEPDMSGCSPLNVQFQNLSVLAEKYQWTFGDQGTSNVENPSNQYFNNTIYDSTFTVTMIGTSKYDCSDTAYSHITVYPQPEARFKVSPTYMEYPDATVSIANQTKPGFWNFLWDFGDGTPTLTDRDPSPHTYSTWGETPPYTISLTTQSAHCTHTFTQPVAIRPPKPRPGFTVSPNGCEPWTIQFTDASLWAKNVSWDFGDGGGGPERNPKHTYDNAGVYNVKLTVFGYKPGDVDFIYHQVIVHPKPEIQFAYSPDLVMLPDAGDGSDSQKALVRFTNMSKYATQFLWDFGDGNQSSEESPSHIYTAIGIYDVTLSGWSQNGCFDSLRKAPAVKVISPGRCDFPNAFTPNTSGPNDGKYKKDDKDNDVFHPFWDGVVEFNMEIYDRWGEKLFESNDINKGWNGYYKGKLCKADVYVFKAKGKYADRTDFAKVGDVTLIR